MGRSGLEHLQELTVAMDYGQFSLDTGYQDDPDAAMDALQTAIEGDRIAQHGPSLIVLSPHQNNFAMPLRIERWNAEPPDDLDAWQEAFIASVTVDDFGMRYNSPTLIGAELDVTAGRYTIRITGRGFVNYGWPGSTTPGDDWRVQLWPFSQAVKPARLRAWPGAG